MADEPAMAIAGIPHPATQNATPAKVARSPVTGSRRRLRLLGSKDAESMGLR